MSELVAASALNVAALPATSAAMSGTGPFPGLSDTLDIVGLQMGALTTAQAFLLGIGVGAVAVMGLGVGLGRMRRRRAVGRTLRQLGGSRTEADERGGARVRQMRWPRGVVSPRRPQGRAGAGPGSPVADIRYDSLSAGIVDVDHASLPAGNGGTLRADKQIVELAAHVARRLAKGHRSRSDPDPKAQSTP